MVDVGDKPVTDREAVARGSIAMSGNAQVDSFRQGEERRPAASRAAGRNHGGEDQRADSAVPPVDALAFRSISRRPKAATRSSRECALPGQTGVDRRSPRWPSRR